MSSSNKVNEVNASSIEALMERTGFSPGTLAAACDPPISRSYVVNIIAGRRQPSAVVAVRLAQALRVPLAAILADPNRQTDEVLSS